ncbi:nitronate monooxygenase [Verticiella sediminum]|uniref:Nitronate monooxygenase n=2 Tax=Verticiella sediminum TaxID=1247510 RepID=A0A556B272_9BURK|nr:nitronate monooxygenase [Verticiella sediminum]
MLRVSGPALVAAVRAQGAVGAFPTANARSVEELDDWVAQIKRLGAGIEALPPYCPNLIMRQARLKDDLACLLRHGVEMVITSVGSPAPVVQPLHDIGCLVFADVASIEHAEKALRAGADGLILLTAGAGGQTGWANGFAFVRAVRAFFDGPLVMAGGMSDGAALLAAQVAGCDLGYMGTRFIATRESMAAEAYKAMLVESRLDDVMLTRAFTGLDANMLRPSVVAAGLDPANLEELNSEEIARRKYGGGQGQEGPKRWKDIWSAGHSVSGIDGVDTVAGLMARTREEYESARQRARRLLE